MRKGQPYTDNEIREILLAGPFERNVPYFAEKCNRTSAAIRLIYRIASCSDKEIRSTWSEKMGKNNYIMQILRIRKELGWLATGTAGRKGRI